MNLVAVLRALPQPLKTLYALWIVGVLVAVVLEVTTRSDAAMAPLGAIAVLTGLTLLTDFRGGTRALAEEIRRQRPGGIDYSRSFFATTAYGRVFGALAIVVGAGLVCGAVGALR